MSFRVVSGMMAGGGGEGRARARPGSCPDDNGTRLPSDACASVPTYAPGEARPRPRAGGGDRGRGGADLHPEPPGLEADPVRRRGPLRVPGGPGEQPGHRRDLLPCHLPHQPGLRPTGPAAALGRLPGRQPGHLHRHGRLGAGPARGEPQGERVRRLPAPGGGRPRWRARARRWSVAGRLPDPAGERGGHGRHRRAQLRGAGRHSRRRRCRTRPPAGRLPRYAASVGLGRSATPRWRRPTTSWPTSTPSSGWTGCAACTSTTPRSSWGPTGTATPTWARGPSARSIWACCSATPPWWISRPSSRSRGMATGRAPRTFRRPGRRSNWVCGRRRP